MKAARQLNKHIWRLIYLWVYIQTPLSRIRLDKSGDTVHETVSAFRGKRKRQEVQRCWIGQIKKILYSKKQYLWRVQRQAFLRFENLFERLDNVLFGNDSFGFVNFLLFEVIRQQLVKQEINAFSEQHTRGNNFNKSNHLQPGFRWFSVEVGAG